MSLFVTSVDALFSGRYWYKRSQLLPIIWLLSCNCWVTTGNLSSHAAKIDYSGASSSNISSYAPNILNGTISHQIVFPRRAGDHSMITAINGTIYKMLQTAQVTTVESPLSGIEFWLLSVTPVELRAVKQIPNVSMLSRTWLLPNDRLFRCKLWRTP